MRLLVVLVLLARVARADDLATARELEAKLEYEQALTIVDGILAKGGADPARYAELHVFAGRLAAGLDRVDIAREHFAKALAVRPTTTLPEGTSPKITEPFAAARSRAAPLAVTITARSGLVSIDAADSLGLVSGISVHVLVAGKHEDRVERAARRIVIADDAQVIEVAALDAAGNRLWVGAPPSTPVVIKPAMQTTRPLYARWSTYAVIGGIALVGAGISAWRFGVAQNEWDSLDREGGHDFSELQAVEDRGKRWGLFANIGLGVTSISGIAAIVVGLRHNGDRDLVIAPTTNGAAISGRF